jgi:hypothetical protein
MNDLVAERIWGAIVGRAKGAVMSTRLRGSEHNVDEVDFWNVAFWSREA